MLPFWMVLVLQVWTLEDPDYRGQERTDIEQFVAAISN
jgi:hypothetical protein